ncbi:MAG: DUF1700 domain-containing protein [Mobilitalea sp.]
MTKQEFMNELESLLLDIPLEEREEAIQYYNGYFEDAGEDREDEIVIELGSPAKVAAIIKADLNSNAADRENRGYFTENGYQDNSYNNEKFEMVGMGKKKGGSNNDSANTDNTSNANRNTNNNSAYGNGSNDSANYNSAGQTTQKPKEDKSTRNVLLGILAVCTFPIWLPVLCTIFGIVIAVVATILGLVFGLGVAGIAMIGVGIALIVAGVVQLSIPLAAMLLCGAGLVVLGLGMLFVYACVLLCKNVLPAVIRGVVNLCRMPFQNRSVTA